MSDTKKVLMICLGNICRSPIAEAVFRDQLKKRNLTGSWEVSSAALIGYHTGKAPDRRAMAVLRDNGIADYTHKARPIAKSDFYTFDWIFGMDNENISELLDMKPENSRAQVELLGNYDSVGPTIIRDPYYDHDTRGFQEAYEQCLRSIGTFLDAHKGNSCRSPMAEAVFKNEIKRMELTDAWEVDSAAILGYHVGKTPEARAIASLEKAGITGYTHKTRQIKYEDFYEFDWIFGMDYDNIRELYEMQPSDSRAKIELLGKYDPDGELVIRDPYFDENNSGFEKALEQAARSVKVFLEKYKSIL